MNSFLVTGSSSPGYLVFTANTESEADFLILSGTSISFTSRVFINEPISCVHSKLIFFTFPKILVGNFIWAFVVSKSELDYELIYEKIENYLMAISDRHKNWLHNY